MKGQKAQQQDVHLISLGGNGDHGVVLKMVDGRGCE